MGVVVPAKTPYGSHGVDVLGTSRRSIGESVGMRIGDIESGIPNGIEPRISVGLHNIPNPVMNCVVSGVTRILAVSGRTMPSREHYGREPWFGLACVRAVNRLVCDCRGIIPTTTGHCKCSGSAHAVTAG